MQVRRIAGSIATILLAGATAFAQSDDRSTNAREKQGSTSTSTQAENATGTMTVVGCLMREADYRKAHNLGKGTLGGVGLGDEFVLVDATTVSTSDSSATTTNNSSPATSRPTSSATCSETGSGQAYRMTGKLEDKLKPFVGHRMEITGQFDHPRDAKTAAGETNAKLPAEIKIASYREASARQAPATASTPAPTPAPSAQTAPPPASAPQTVASNQAPERERLPKTASNEPLFALIGLICLSAAFGVHVLRVRLS